MRQLNPAALAGWLLFSLVWLALWPAGADAAEPAAIEVELGTSEHSDQDNAELDLDEVDLDELDLDELDLDEIRQAGLTEEEPDGAAAADAELDLGNIDVAGTASLLALLGDSRAVTIVDAAQFGTAQSLSEVLERLPGADIRLDGGTGQLAMLQLRGARAEQVLVLVDGAPIGQGNTDLSQIPLGAVARVELLHGPQAVRFGTGALGGVLNVVTKAPPAAGAADGAAPTLAPSWFKLTLGTDSLGQAELLSYQGGASIYLSHLQARNNFDFVRTGGNSATRANNEAIQDDIWLSWRNAEQTYRAGATSLQRGVPGSAEQPTTLAQLARQRVWWSMQDGEKSADFTITRSHFTDPDPFLGGTALNYQDTLVQAQAAWGTLANQRGQWGVKPQLAYLDSTKWGEHTRAGLDAHYYFEQPAGSLLMQFDVGLVANSDAGIDPTARLGFSRQLDSATQVYASGSYAVRHPTFHELYYLDTGGVRGNPDLLPERVLGAELGWRYTRRVSASAAAFFSSYTDSIMWLPVSSYLVEARNTGRAEVGGLECTLELPFGGQWSMQSAYTWLPLAQFASSTPLAGRSQHHVNASINYGAACWAGSLTCDYTGSMPADLFGNLVIPPRTLWNTEVTYEFASTRIGLAVSNLFSQDARDSWNYPLPGREFQLSYQLKF